MANVATMGPPPSPKEPRRSGRRTVPSASTSKSPAGSPASDTAPKSKDSSNRPPVSSSANSGKGKRGKQEDQDEALEGAPKNGINGNGNARAKRKGGSKDKDKTSTTDGGVDTPRAETHGGDTAAQPEEEEEEEAGVTRCICEGTGADDDADIGEFMIQCEMCKTWQHGQCMGHPDLDNVPNHYYCELCRPDMYVDLLKKYAKKARHSSTNSHNTTTAAGNTSRSSRSHSPTHLLKTTKRRNTMNSRDAAYEESVQAIIEATAAEAAAAANESISNTSAATLINGASDKHAEIEQETEVTNNTRKKRKRSDDDALPTKRTRSSSTASNPPPPSVLRDPTPVNGATAKPSPVSAPTTKTTRNRRGGGRKAQVQELMTVEGDEANSTASASNARRATTSRAKATAGQDHGGRRAQTNATNAASSASASRAYHHSHAYAVSQQPLFTSWNLPDYLAHLEPMLPTNVPRPLEVRGSGVDATGRESLERTTERGVKVRWPSKRMSVGDMNKRVRALVEWVGREQANSLERTRRRDAVGRALREAQDMQMDFREPPGDGAGTTAVTTASVVESPLQENPNIFEGETAPGQEAGLVTMKMMEELMEELISFQERFGPGAKTKERERRTNS
ncbi:predicted protein [Sparassis crispa]|uniref:Zinc finger PHD-type domain-containing protein n=1 Tax=Sparassis crispa TaxID=139825 RepID=A0A401GEJ3_9APHY|nr:predicted protein [Sparassis crispa]GBE80614.1 predicted protein [Sparassis crispa]